MGERRGTYKVLVEKPEVKSNWEDVHLDAKIILTL
jgi:hypothetical protein